MGKLADKMQMDMDLRNLSPRTKSCYLSHMRAFAKHYQAASDGLGEEEIRGYLHHLIVQRKASQATVSQAYSALKFFYMTTLGRN